MFGFYRVADQTVFSKVEALEAQRRQGGDITWHYNDDIFTAQDWSKEPYLDLCEIYQNRARQIRDHYDHVVVFYSGGADSHNMLESFISSGCHIDEIVSFHSFSKDHDKHSEFNREIFETAVPYVEKCRSDRRLPDTTLHRLIDMGDVILAACQDIDWHDLRYMITSAPSINNVARFYLRQYVREWTDLVVQGQRLVLVWGHDKPRVMQEHDCFYLNFLDIFDNCVSTWVQQHSPAGWFDEMFYSTPDMPEIVVKQAHVIKKFLQVSHPSHPWLTQEVTGLGHVTKIDPQGKNQSYWLTQDGQSMLIYPWFQPMLYYESKPLDIIYSPRDRWFWQNKTMSQGYRSAINELVGEFGDQWIRQDAARGIRCTKNFTSKKYWIG